MEKIILASSSPRRKEILEKIGIDFQIIPSDYDETLDDLIFTYKKIENLAFNKAKAVLDANEIKNVIVLSADTVVVLNEKILCKPIDKQDAIRMLKKLSGKKHYVVTSICLINSDNLESKILSTTTYVEFKTLSDNLIINYVEEFKPLDKAGAYGIQELPDGFINSIEGSFENVMGLCPVSLKMLLDL